MINRSRSATEYSRDRTRQPARRSDREGAIAGPDSFRSTALRSLRLLLWSAALLLGSGAVGRLTCADEIVVAGTTLTRRVIVVVDVSGSMRRDTRWSYVRRRDRLEDAIDWVHQIATSLSDDGEIKVVGWADNSASRPWLRLPDGEGLAVATMWLRSIQVGTGTTAGATTVAALLASEDHPDVSVVLISDMDWGAGDAATIAAANAARRSGPAPVAVIGVHTTEGVGDRLATQIATESGAPYLRTDNEEDGR